MTRHECKSWPEFFAEIRAGRKTHELRRNDRGFVVGDIIELREFDPISQKYTGCLMDVEISFVTSADVPCALSKGALHQDFCILSVKRVF